jgi:hypothetical protein
MSSIRSFVTPSQAQRNDQYFVIPTAAERSDPQYFVIRTEAERSERSGGTCFCLQLRDCPRIFLPPVFGSRH